MSTATLSQVTAFGRYMKQWRRQRGLIQLELAVRADVSQRHVSFIETGRSRPREDVVRKVAEALEVPLRERNILLEAAGLAPGYPEVLLSDGAATPFRNAVQKMLESHEPYPAYVINRWWELIDANAAGRRMLPLTGDGPISLVDVFLGPGPIREMIVNFSAVGWMFLRRLRREVADSGPDERLQELLKRAEAYMKDVPADIENPGAAVERAIEIQDRLHGHPHLSVRIGIDMGEVCGEYVGDELTDIFGRHVDWAARATALADGGHISVTRAVYIDAFSWLTKSRIAWEEHGSYSVKPGEPPLDIFEPYNANITKPLSELRGTKVEGPTKASTQRSEPSAPKQLRLVRPWEAVARDGRDFAEKGGGMMYWFKVPLGGICYAEGFRNFLVPALVNQRITKIRFLLDSSNPIYQQIWNNLVLPLLVEWAKKENRAFVVEELVVRNL